MSQETLGEVESLKELDLPCILIDIGIEDRLPDRSSFPLIFRHFEIVMRITAVYSFPDSSSPDSPY